MKREIVLLVVLVAILGALLYFAQGFKKTSEADARKFFLENLAQNYPDADVREIYDVTSEGDTLHLKARVSFNISTPCPERLHVLYNYPAKNFVYEVETITTGCVVCRDVPKCQILWPEEAIIASHSYPGGQRIADYIKTYPDAKPNATFMQDYNGESAVWKVAWDSPAASNGMNAYVSQSGNRIIGTESVPKSS